MLAVERLHFDDVGAHVAQDLAGRGAGDDLREIENQRVGERKHGARTSVFVGSAPQRGRASFAAVCQGVTE